MSMAAALARGCAGARLLRGRAHIGRPGLLGGQRIRAGGQQTRGVSVFRRVAFPPEDKVPLVWGLYAALLLSNTLDAQQLRWELDVRESIRRASSEAWGVDRVLAGLDALLSGVALSHGWAAWLNAGPQAVELGVVEKVVLPGLRSENVDVADASAELLSRLLAQRPFRDRQDDKLLGEVLAALERWMEMDCLDCGNPAPALDSLVNSVLFLTRADGGSKALVGPHKERLVAIAAKLAAKVEDGARRTGWRLDRAWLRYPEKPPVLGPKHSADWFYPVGLSVVEICEFICEQYPEHALEFIPAYNSLSRALWGSDEGAVESPTFQLGMHIAKRFQATKPVRPESVLPQQWHAFRRSLDLFKELDGTWLLRVSQAFDRLKLDSLANVLVGGVVGFAWAGARTLFALRKAEPPQPRAPVAGQPFAPPQAPSFGQPPAAAYGARPPPPSPSAYGQPPAYGQPHPAYGQPQPGYGQPQPGYGQPQPGYGQTGAHPSANYARHAAPSAPPSATAWRRAMVIKHGRLAALGTMLMVSLTELRAVIGNRLWVSDPKSQSGVTFVGVVADLAAFLTVLRAAPFTFVPTMLCSAGSPDYLTIDYNASLP